MSDESSPVSVYARRLIVFLRSVLPAEPAQLLLLAGATFLFMSPELRWWPDPPRLVAGGTIALGRLGREYEPFPGIPLFLWASYVRLLSLPILAAGAVGYFACFRRSLGNSCRTLLWILACAVTGLLAVCGVAFFFWRSAPGSHSVFSSVASRSIESLRDLPSLFVELGPGLRFASAGLLMVAIFTFLVWTRRATLPMRLPSLPAHQITEAPPDAAPRDLAVFIPVMIGLIPLLRMITGLVAMPFALWWPALFATRRAPWIVGLESVVDALFFAAFVFVAIGKERREFFPRCARFPKANYLVLAGLLPTAVFQVWPLISYLRDRIVWAHIHQVFTYPPNFPSYFGLPRLSALWYLLPAFVEEIAWRGYLQPRFIRRYGLWRGIFLVGLVWGAFHFSSDFSSYMSDAQVLIGIAARLAWIVAFSYFLAWLTIRSESILPSTIAHGVYNMFVLGALPTHTPIWILVPLLALLGYAVFRFWPPVMPGENSTPELRSEMDTAT